MGRPAFVTINEINTKYIKAYLSPSGRGLLSRHLTSFSRVPMPRFQPFNSRKDIYPLALQK